MELWYTEYQTKNVGITCKVKQTYHTEKTQYQDIALIDTEQFGKMLVLDGTVQTTIEDEFVYHEMISHVPLATHKTLKSPCNWRRGRGAIRKSLSILPSKSSAL